MSAPTKSEKKQSRSEHSDDLSKLPITDLLARLHTSPDGLSQAEARNRLEQYGPNALQEKAKARLLTFLGYFWGPIPWMIEVAAVLSAVVGHWVDLIIILGPAVVQCRRGVLAGTSGGQCGRRAQKTARPQGPRQTRRSVDRNRLRSTWCPATSCVCAWATSSPPTCG